MKLKTSKKEFDKDGLGDLLGFCEEGANNLADFELDDERPEEIRQSDFQPSSSKWSSKGASEKKRKFEQSNESEEEESDFECSDEDDGASGDEDESEEEGMCEAKGSTKKPKANQDEFKPSATKWVSKRLLENKKKFEQSKRELEGEDSEDELAGFDDDELDANEASGDYENDESIDEDNESVNESINESIEEDEQAEDIYGRSIKEKKRVVTGLQVGKSLPEDGQAEKELTKKVRGLLNRIALKTLPFIASELEQIFQKHSNNLVCRCLFNCIDQLVIKDQILASQRLCTEIAMLIAICHSRIGEEVSANILHQLVRTLDGMFEQLSVATSGDAFNNNKELENLLMMICSMYGVNIVSDELTYNILDKLTEIFNSKSIELILFCLKLVGYLLRKDNTSLMKSLILAVQQKASAFDKEKINEKKVVFMLNALTSIKNNVSLKMDLSDIQSIVPIDKQTMKNDLRSLFKDINVSCLKGKYSEILRSNRWFVHSGELLEISMKRKVEKQKEMAIPTLSEKLCKKLQLTTPFRKLIFNTIFTCEDYIECSQNIIKATKKDHFESILVCLHICLNEKTFNPFYVHLLRYLAHIDRNYKRGILFNVKEKIKNIGDLNAGQQANLERTIVELIKLSVLPLLVFDVIDFRDMTELYNRFTCNILESLFKECELEQLDAIFKRLPKKSQLSTSIRVFIGIFLPDECKVKTKQIKSGHVTSSKIF